MADVTDAFCANPERFMENNSVLIPEATVPSDTKAGIQYFQCFSGAATISNKPNGKVCYLKLATENDKPALPAYWCPYEQNGLKSVMLADDALFAFTPTMNGCSLGLGSANGASQMMHHVNAAAIGKEWESVSESEGRARQAMSQFNQLRHSKNCDFILGPNDYRQGDNTINSTTFAVQALSRPWIIKTLTYRKTGNSYFHNGVR